MHPFAITQFSAPHIAILRKKIANLRNCIFSAVNFFFFSTLVAVLAEEKGRESPNHAIRLTGVWNLD